MNALRFGRARPETKRAGVASSHSPWAYLPICALLLVIGPEIIRFLFTDRYASAWPIFAVNVALLSLSIVLLDPLYRTYAEQRYFLIRVRTLLVILEIFLLWIGTTHFGLVGAISAVVAVNLTERIVTSIRFGRIAGVTREDLSALGDVGKIVLAGTGAALVSFLVRARIISGQTSHRHTRVQCGLYVDLRDWDFGS